MEKVKLIGEEIEGCNRAAMATRVIERGGREEVADRIATERGTEADVEEYNALAAAQERGRRR